MTLCQQELPETKVGDWQSWTPTKGVEQPSNKEGEIATSTQPSISWADTAMSNRTLQEVEDEANDQDEDNVDTAVEEE